MKRYIFIGFFFLSLFSFSQKQLTFNDEINFLIHLSGNKLFNESETFYNNVVNATDITIEQQDTLNYLMGFIYYQNDSLEKAKQYLQRVTDATLLYYKSKMYHSYVCLKLNQPDSSIYYLNKIDSSTNSEINELKNFQLSASYLLAKDLQKFDLLSSKLNSNVKELKEEQLNLIQYGQIHKKNKRKSPFLAGSLSAIIPGLGKVYAGNTAQGLATFLRVGILGAITAENYFLKGNREIRDPQAILFAGLFTAFYIGNIWGSALSVQIVKTEKDLENKANILVGISVPLKKFFN